MGFGFLEFSPFGSGFIVVIFLLGGLVFALARATVGCLPGFRFLGCCDSVFALLGILCGWICVAELWFVFDFGFPGILGGFLGFGVLRVFWVFGVLDFGLVLVCGSWVVISWWWWVLGCFWWRGGCGAAGFGFLVLSVLGWICTCVFWVLVVCGLDYLGVFVDFPLVLSLGGVGVI